MLFLQRNRNRALLIVVTLLFTVIGADGQQKNAAGHNEFQTSCEEAIYTYALALQKNDSRREKGAALIIVNRLGVGEKESITTKRIELLQKHLLGLKPAFEVLFVKGDRSSGLGKAQFYIEGVLFDEMRFAKNQFLDLDVCWV